MELQPINQSQLANTTTKVELAKALYHINYLTSFPYSDIVLEGWTNSIIELEPEITPEVVKWITDRMKVGLIEFDSKKGIQNIFNGFRKYIDLQIQGNKTGVLNKWNDLYRKYNLIKNHREFDGLL